MPCSAGGSACPGESASANVRLLPLFNQTFNDRFAVTGRMEAGKVDNYYALFQAGGVDWLVLSLELWPRTAVVDWARSVVAAHPTHNVIVVKRGKGAGYSGIENALFYKDNCRMLYGSAQEAIGEVITHVKALES